MYFIQYLNTFVKKSVVFVSLFNFSVSLLHFPSSFFGFPFKFRGKKRNMKNTKLDPKIMKGCLKIFLLQSILARISQSEGKLHRFCRENSGKIQFDRRKKTSFLSAPTVFVGV